MHFVHLANVIDLKKILKHLGFPIIEEFPFIVIYILLMGSDTLRNLHGRLLTFDPQVGYGNLFGRYAIYFSMAYILSCIIVFRRWTKPFIYGFFLLFFFLEKFLLVFFGFHISAKLLTLLYETTPNESSEFIKTFLFSWDFSLFVSIAVLLVCAILFLEKLYKRYKNKFFTERLCVYIGGCVFLLLLTSVFYGRTYVDLLNMHTTDEVCIWSGNKFCNPNDPFTNLLAACRSVSVSSNEMEREVIATENAGGKIVSDDSLNVVFVIGESFIKYHSSVYGYYLQTTPNMQKERDRGNLFVFNNVMSPYNYTSAAIRNMMSTNSLSDGEKWYDFPYFPAIFKNAGYKVFFWDNQKNVYDGTGASFALNTLLYQPVIQKLAYTKTNKKSFLYDAELIEDFKKNIVKQKLNKHNLFIFHLMGQHINAKERFPNNRKWNYFKISDIKAIQKYINDEKKQSIANYDNATRYNDFILKDLFDYFNNTNTVLVYLSDHGEEVYDYRDSQGRVGGRMCSDFVKYQYDIPMIIWCSDRFKRKNVDLLCNIPSCTNKPLCSDNICQVLFKLGFVSSKYYIEDRCILSDKYKAKIRKINGDLNYDTLRFNR